MWQGIAIFCNRYILQILIRGTCTYWGVGYVLGVIRILRKTINYYYFYEHLLFQPTPFSPHPSGCSAVLARSEPSSNASVC